ncbi:MAG: ribosome maturation factor RimP [Bacteroidota bacterium]
MGDIKRQIQEILQPFLDDKQAFLVDMVIRNDPQGKLLQVLVETDKGITIQECAEISRALGKELEIKGVLEGPYHLEVSSPGLDKPLRLLRQYPKNIGRTLKVRFVRNNAPAEIVGTLSAVDGNRLTVTPKTGDAVTIVFENIIESEEQLPW